MTAKKDTSSGGGKPNLFASLFSAPPAEGAENNTPFPPYSQWLRTVSPELVWDYPHLAYLRKHLADVTLGTCRKLRIAIPPQHYKPVWVGTSVPTGTGERVRLGEIRVGDSVITHRGGPRRVLGVHEQGELACVRVRVESGRELVAALDHPVLTPAGWVRAGELRVGSVLGVPCVWRTETGSGLGGVSGAEPGPDSGQDQGSGGVPVGPGGCGAVRAEPGPAGGVPRDLGECAEAGRRVRAAAEGVPGWVWRAEEAEIEAFLCGVLGHGAGSAIPLERGEEVQGREHPAGSGSGRAVLLRGPAEREVAGCPADSGGSALGCPGTSSVGVRVAGSGGGSVAVRACPDAGFPAGSELAGVSPAVSGEGSGSTSLGCGRGGCAGCLLCCDSRVVVVSVGSPPVPAVPDPTSSPASSPRCGLVTVREPDAGSPGSSSTNSLGSLRAEGGIFRSESGLVWGGGEPLSGRTGAGFGGELGGRVGLARPDSGGGRERWSGAADWWAGSWSGRGEVVAVPGCGSVVSWACPGHDSGVQGAQESGRELGAGWGSVCPVPAVSDAFPGPIGFQGELGGERAGLATLSGGTGQGGFIPEPEADWAGGNAPGHVLCAPERDRADVVLSVPDAGIGLERVEVGAVCCQAVALACPDPAGSPWDACSLSGLGGFLGERAGFSSLSGVRPDGVSAVWGEIGGHVRGSGAGFLSGVSMFAPDSSGFRGGVSIGTPERVEVAALVGVSGGRPERASGAVTLSGVQDRGSVAGSLPVPAGGPGGLATLSGGVLEGAQAERLSLSFLQGVDTEQLTIRRLHVKPVAWAGSLWGSVVDVSGLAGGAGKSGAGSVVSVGAGSGERGGETGSLSGGELGQVDASGAALGCGVGGAGAAVTAGIREASGMGSWVSGYSRLSLSFLQPVAASGVMVERLHVKPVGGSLGCPDSGERGGSAGGVVLSGGGGVRSVPAGWGAGVLEGSRELVDGVQHLLGRLGVRSRIVPVGAWRDVESGEGVGAGSGSVGGFWGVSGGSLAGGRAGSLVPGVCCPVGAGGFGVISGVEGGVPGDVLSGSGWACWGVVSSGVGLSASGSGGAGGASSSRLGSLCGVRGGVGLSLEYAVGSVELGVGGVGGSGSRGCGLASPEGGLLPERASEGVGGPGSVGGGLCRVESGSGREGAFAGGSWALCSGGMWDVPVSGWRLEVLGEGESWGLLGGEYWVERVVGVEDAGQLPCRCLSVEEDGTFLAGDLVVSNTQSVTVRYPLWRMLREPGLRVGVGTYNQRYANKVSRWTRRLVERLGVKFGDSSAVDSWTLSNGSSYIARGAGVGLSGEPVDLWLCDDPFKNREQADSERIQERVWEWHMDDVTPRIQQGGAYILIHTRWSVGDLHGRIGVSEDAPNWRYVRLPALAETQEERDVVHLRQGLGLGEGDPLGREPGEPLCAAAFSRLSLEDKRRVLGIGFETLYQQNDIARGGEFFRRDWFEPAVESRPEGGVIRRVRYYDLASSRSDQACYTAGVLMSKVGEGEESRYFIEDVVRGRWSPGERNERMLQTAVQDALLPGFERTWFEKPVFDREGEASRAILARLSGHPVRADEVGGRGSKELRAEPLADAARGGLVKVVSGTWVGAFLTELEGFPRAGFKDQVDSCASAYTKLAGKRGLVVGVK